MHVVCDTDFLSSFLKIGRLELAKEFFGVDTIHIPVAVLYEIAKTDLITDLLDKHWILVKKVNDVDLIEMECDIWFASLGSGEKECMVLCRQFQDSILLISDKKAMRVASKSRITVLNIPALLLACKETGVLDGDEIAVIVRDLKKMDYYEFSYGEECRLME
jgi:predicted nucleic acid-binding protein